METVEILQRARDLLSEPRRWTQGHYAKTASGGFTDPLAPDACMWCVQGAISVAQAQFSDCSPAQRALQQAVGGVAFRFNDDPRTTHADVLAAFDRAIEKAA